jgi:hypothetical protein
MRDFFRNGFVSLGERVMPVGRNAMLCGLYLDFAGVRDCVVGVKSTGVRGTGMSVILRDGSITPAAAIPMDPQRFEAALRGRDAALAAGGPNNNERVMPMAIALTKTLLTMGVPVYDSERLESKIRNGGILISIRCDDSVAEQVREVLIQTGAQDISRGRDAKELERCSILQKAPYTPASVNGWQQQRSVHA